jgi:hypothetical protein
MELDGILENLCAAVPEAIGAVLCDYEGETVVSVIGSAGVPPEAKTEALQHVPKTIGVPAAVEEFLVRLAGAEPCALLRGFGTAAAGRGAGILSALECRYEHVELLIQCLPNDYYIVLILRRPAITASARRYLTSAQIALSDHVA